MQDYEINFKISKAVKNSGTCVNNLGKKLTEEQLALKTNKKR